MCLSLNFTLLCVIPKPRVFTCGARDLARAVSAPHARSLTRLKNAAFRDDAFREGRMKNGFALDDAIEEDKDALNTQTDTLPNTEARAMISDLLISEFDDETKKTRATLERVPIKPDFTPHPKSMPLGKLAPHVAQLPDFGLIVLTTPELDFGTTKWTPLPFESAEQLVKAFDEGAAKVRTALKNTPDEAWTQPWKLSFQGKPLFSGSRFLAYRQMFLNHLVHHRAQLGVYLRLNDKPLPAIYGPSADDRMGF
jgi:hypothetical protein